MSLKYEPSSVYQPQIRALLGLSASNAKFMSLKHEPSSEPLNQVRTRAESASKRLALAEKELEAHRKGALDEKVGPDLRFMGDGVGNEGCVGPAPGFAVCARLSRDLLLTSLLLSA